MALTRAALRISPFQPPCPASWGLTVFSFLARGFASLSLTLKQPLSAFCDLETAHGDALITKRGDYLSWIRVDGMQRMAERRDFAEVSEAMRLDLSGALETRGHAIVGWYISDPDAALVEIERLNLASCRAVAREVGLDLHDILEERARLWPRLISPMPYMTAILGALAGGSGRPAT